MMKTMKHLILVVVVAIASTAGAAPAPTTAPRSRGSFHLDVELDPTAYLLGGYSGHVGLGWSRARLDLGVYAMNVPQMVHGNAGWDVAFDGAGAKLQWFPFAEQRGAFLDVSGGATRQRVTLRETGTAQRDTVFGVGIDAGYRFSLPYRFYATVWGGIGYDVNADDVMVDGKTYTRGNWSPFAAVHVGYRFR